MREIRIFYSWQGDDGETSDFIRNALKSAVDDLCLEFGSKFRVVLDKDTHGEIGAPNITNTILKKIDEAIVVVSDVSYVGECRNKKIVNQNVMFETGYAIAKHSTNSVIMLFNRDKGSLRDLPFDISHNRVTSFCISDGSEKLRLMLFNLIKPILNDSSVISVVSEASSLKLDAEQIEIMKIFASIRREKCIILSDFSIFGIKVWSRHKYDKERKTAIMDRIGLQKFIANMNDLVDKNILRKRAEG